MAPSGSKQSSTKKQITASGNLQHQQQHQQQRTISQLFSSSQQKPFTPVELSPSSKRKRPISSQDIPPSRRATTVNMYDFSSKSPIVIDASSPRIKQRRISVGAKVDNAPTQGGIKKLAVRNFKANPMPNHDEFVKRNLAMLDSALTAIFSDQRPAKSSEELYRACENLCKMGYAEKVAKLVMNRFEAHINNVLSQVLSQISGSTEDMDALSSILLVWETWMNQVKEVRGIFFYLDRSHLLQNKAPSIHDSAIALFRVPIFHNAAIRSRVIDGACELLLAERSGKATIEETALFTSAVKMFQDLHVYTTDLEPRMMALSQTYIADWSEKECVRNNLPDFVDLSVQLIAAELKRCEEFNLENTTRRSLLALLEDHLIERRLSDLTNDGAVAEILDQDTRTAADDMRKLFDLLQKKRAGARLKYSFCKWLEDTGSAIILAQKQEDQEKMVIRLLEFKQKLDHIWRKSFDKNEKLGHALRDTFETLMNKPPPKTMNTHGTNNLRTGEMIAKYVDMLLRSGAKAIPSQVKTVGGIKPPRAFTRAVEEVDGNAEIEIDDDAEVENQLDQVLDLFRFLKGKDVFEAFYKKDLARRLLLGRSASNDAEKNMLERLKTECGSGFTHNLEQMFKDIELAEEEAKAYKNRFSERPKGIVDLSVSVLSSAAWPTYPEVPVAIPPEVKRSLDDYSQFYHSKHSGRKLVWKHALADCQMKADFPRGKKDLVVSAFQAVILLLFNGHGDDEHLSYEHIKAESGLSPIELSRTLQSLACAKLRPLTKHPRSRDINTTDTFTINTTFSHDKYRVKINSIQLRETKEENAETHVRVAADRQFETQATIVRILKEKKRIGHAQLIAAVIEKTRTRGVLQPGEIKREIDKLIEKEYLERVDGGGYEYLA